MKRKHLLLGGAATLLIILVMALAVHRWADTHVRYITGGQPGPGNCLPCHIYTKNNALIKYFVEKDYFSPLRIAVSRDGKRLYVTAEEAGALLVMLPEEGQLLAKIPVGKHPQDITLSRDGKTAYVSNQWSNSVSVIDLVNLRLSSTITVGAGPAGLTIGPNGNFLYVANSYSDDISIIDLKQGRELKRLSAGSSPYAVGLSPDGQAVYVTNRFSNPAPFLTPPVTEVTVVDVESQRITQRKIFNSAHQIESVDFTPNSDWAIVTLARPKNLVPMTQVSRGWTVTFGLGIIERGKGGKIIQVLLDEANRFFADPHQIVVTPDGQRAFVSQAGANCVTVVDLKELKTLLSGATEDNLNAYANHLGLSSRFVIKRIATGANPKGLALSPDGRRLYVAERLEDRIAVIDTETLTIVENLELGKPQSVSLARRGRQLFNNANAGAFQGQFSCRTCHPNGDQDRLTYDIAPDGLGQNFVNIISLRDIGQTAPFKWNGKNVSLYQQCGIRFAKFLTRAEPLTPDNLNALAAYIVTIPYPDNLYQDSEKGLTPSQKRGKIIFERTKANDGRLISANDRCITCHNPPYYTNRKLADVGTAKPNDTGTQFDTPSLINIYQSPPYLHDGSAATLEEIWTKFNPDDRHGIANDMTKDQLNDLVEYLRALGLDSNDREKIYE